ncbi:hypothetical protein [Mesorhizobium sp. ISC15]|uniref:hypothetical protein n=1 Tax=Mesorhizobium sp. ISC15 TaxID=3076429 RepID=UPI00301C4C90
MKVFWSWQSDTPGKIGRFLIRDAILAAIEQLQVAPDVEDADRQELREALHLDSDRQGVPGSPDLALTIFRKIEAAGVVVADVTPVGEAPAKVDSTGQQIAPPKKLMNPNVAIELGYALHALTDQKLIMVCNEHYGVRDDLPFDLKHKAGPIFFNLAPDADKPTIEAAKAALRGAFSAALRPYLDGLPAAPTPRTLESPSTYLPAVYFAPNETLAKIGEPDDDEINFQFAADKLCYLRLIPVDRLAVPLPVATLNAAATHAPLLTRASSGAFQRLNQYGVIKLEPGNNPPRGVGRIAASTQLFRNGELWAIGSNLIRTERGIQPAHVPIPLLPLFPFEQAYYRCLKEALRLMSRDLSLNGPWKVVLGVTGLAGVHYGVSNDVLGPVHGNTVEYSTVINEPTEGAIEGALLPFFEQVYDLSGYPRPLNLHGFPRALEPTEQE